MEPEPWWMNILRNRMGLEHDSWQEDFLVTAFGEWGLLWAAFLIGMGFIVYKLGKWRYDHYWAQRSNETDETIDNES